MNNIATIILTGFVIYIDSKKTSKKLIWSIGAVQPTATTEFLTQSKENKVAVLFHGRNLFDLIMKQKFG